MKSEIKQCQNCRKDFIIEPDDFGFYENPVHSKLVKLVYRLFWFYFPLKNVAIVTVVSEFTKAKLVHYFKFPEQRIRVIYDPVKPVFKFVKKENVNELYESLSDKRIDDAEKLQNFITNFK